MLCQQSCLGIHKVNRSFNALSNNKIYKKRLLVQFSQLPWQQDKKQQEKFLDVDSILGEVEQMGTDFVFEDKETDLPVWELEREPSPIPRSDSIQPPVVTPQSVEDVLSAYSEESGFKEIDTNELNQRIKEYSLVLDIRKSAEFTQGHIPGSKNITFDALSMCVRNGDLDEFKQKPIAIICNSGSTSAQATVKLSKVFGFEQVENVRGGMMEWQSQGFDIVQDENQ
eukprot:TRINITY_DN5751_c0_g1_i1.p2 TRINITY_DN5751_c0_g1~~TRINITY_DN5751_c0_g1_i1.p2  ORF type:complete len:226 (-),score=24.00 TRINITY_DN5751_c0_g1_i1:327-1004(-)